MSVIPVSSSSINLVAIIWPAEGKFDRIKQVCADHCVEVERNEPGVLRYELIEEDVEPYRLMMVETYESMDAIRQHSSSESFGTMFKTFEDEGLMDRAPDVFSGRPIAGFQSRS
ncbi:hypothetical protein LTR36_003385 [Oleoguttula mirabilis]|uniref:ABM domain-containing protein n=1 Tax=Oleoguttula mirabilis TaxID=1507867 RepID=A0AAV9JIG3_9PEZI|nr:hypothetical protein LTR36_003385 [Oleoguttula mirabilis]